MLRDRLYATFPDGLPGAPRAAALAARARTAPPPRAAAGGSRSTRPSSAPTRSPSWLAEHESSERMGLALDGTWGRGRGTVTGIAIAAPDGAGAYLDPTELTPDDERALGDWLAADDRPKALHDAKGPMHALASHGFVLHGLTSDTALAAYLALPGQRTFDLADLSLRYLGKELSESAGRQRAADPGRFGRGGVRAGARPPGPATLDLAAALDADLEKRGATRLLHEIELPLVTVLAEMERIGIAADTDHFAEMSATLYGEVKSAEQAAYEVVGHEFNLGSPKQLQEVLFTELEPAEDQADQDRLHDRLRGADEPAGVHRAPGARSTCCTTATWPS